MRLMKSKVVMQECTCCGQRFYVKYYENGTIEYTYKTCECESDFEPIDGEPSISEWIKTLKQ